MNAVSKLPSYTKAEAWRLEDIYLNGYKAEGLIGRGKVPSNGNLTRAQFNLTPAGKARQEKANAAKERAYKLIAQGHDTASDIAAIMRCSGSPVRKYLRTLEKEGRIEVVERGVGLKTKWQIKQLSSLG